jgi:hypothetical protein
MGMKNAPARRVGTAFARPLKGRISKCRDKGGYGIKASVLGIQAADWKKEVGVTEYTPEVGMEAGGAA